MDCVKSLDRIVSAIFEIVFADRGNGFKTCLIIACNNNSPVHRAADISPRCSLSHEPLGNVSDSIVSTKRISLTISQGQTLEAIQSK